MPFPRRSLLALLALLAAVPAARAQVLAGGGLGPGLGGVAVGTQDVLLGLFTREGALYADYQPRVLGGRGRLLVAVAGGGSLRITQALAAARGRAPGTLDVDAGVRVGPAFYYAFFEQSADDEARAFRTAFDPFVRGRLVAFGGRRVFAEVGLQQPSLRAGLVF